MRRTAVLFLVLTSSSYGCGSAQTPAPLIVGHVADLSGPGKKIGERAQMGIRLALEEMNKDTSLRPIVVRHADTAGKLEACEAQSVRLITLSKAVALMGGNTAEEVGRMDRARPPPVAGEQSTLAIVGPWGWRTSSMSEQVYLTGMTPTDQGKVLARHAAHALGVSKLVILVSETQDPARAAAETFAREFVEQQRAKQPKGDVASSRVLFFGKDEKLATHLDHIAKEKTGAVLLAGTVADLRGLCDKRLSTIVLFAGDDGSLSGGDVDCPGAVYFASAFGLDKSIAAIDDFAQKFQRLANEPPDVHAALAYEDVRLLGTAMRNSSGPESLREELMKEHVGLAGKLQFSAGQQMQRPLFVLRREGKKLETVRTYAAP